MKYSMDGRVVPTTNGFKEYENKGKGNPYHDKLGKFTTGPGGKTGEVGGSGKGSSSEKDVFAPFDELQRTLDKQEKGYMGHKTAEEFLEKAEKSVEEFKDEKDWSDKQRAILDGLGELLTDVRVMQKRGASLDQIQLAEKLAGRLLYDAEDGNFARTTMIPKTIETTARAIRKLKRDVKE